ncbi:hypothetical protein I4F81_008409 [Pyropia yezoensis]|uniref:Uncharacterized protein n=1 Tax=Pyropia yezoensis TaxID=2788 RepID=A0ACC3C7C6_PYRYE|nr:hypothetical protein I4F81_008409 [Neopyropia yezoensis]
MSCETTGILLTPDPIILSARVPAFVLPGAPLSFARFPPSAAVTCGALPILEDLGARRQDGLPPQADEMFSPTPPMDLEVQSTEREIGQLWAAVYDVRRGQFPQTRTRPPATALLKVRRSKTKSVRCSALYVRASGGGGKTETVRQFINLKDDSDVVPPEAQRLASESQIYALNFNGMCAVEPAVEDVFMKDSSAYFPLFLRMLYLERADFNSCSWAAFCTACVDAHDAGTLSSSAVIKEVKELLAYRRGHPGAPVLLVVDELLKCNSLKTPKGWEENTVAGKYRSLLCRLLDVELGNVIFATLSYQFVADERTGSNRRVVMGTLLSNFSMEDVVALLDDAFTYLYNVEDLGVKSDGSIGHVDLCVQLDSPEYFELLQPLASLTGGQRRIVSELYGAIRLCKKGATVKGLIQDCGAQVALKPTSTPALGRDKDYTEAVLRVLLLNKAVSVTGTLAKVSRGAKGILTEPVRRQPSDDGTTPYYTFDELASSSSLFLHELDREDVARVTIVPATLIFLENHAIDQPSASLLSVVADLVATESELRWKAWELFHVRWERAVSLARSLSPLAFSRLSLSELYKLSKGTHVGSSPVFHTPVDASVFRSEIETVADAHAFWEFALKPDKCDALCRTLYLMPDGCPGVDAVAFYRRCGTRGGSEILAVLLQFKYTVDAASTMLSTADVKTCWESLSHAGCIGDLWDAWKDKIALIFVARRSRYTISPPKETQSPTKERGTPIPRLEDWSERVAVLAAEDLEAVYGPAFASFVEAADLLLPRNVSATSG